jgi:hypothetical protein
MPGDNMDDLMKIQLEKEFLEHVLEYLSSKEKIDEAVVARGSIKSNNGRMTTNDYFDVDGNYVGHVQLDVGRFNELTMRDAGIERALSMRERLILESVFAMSKQRVQEDHKNLLPHIDDTDEGSKKPNLDFILNLPRLCGFIVEKLRETDLKSQGSFAVNKDMLKKINELRQKKDNIYQILKADEVSDIITDTMQKLEECIDKKSWEQYFVGDYQSPQATISPTIGFFSSQSQVTKENSMIRLAELLKSFSDKPGDYDSERLKAALKELVHACRARSLTGNSKTADSIESQFSGLLSEPVLSVSNKN